jgi:hypothetical protein
MAGRDFSNELFPTSAPSSGRDFSAELFAEENRKRKQLRQSDPILSPEDAVMSSVGAPSTELPLPRKNVAPVDTSQPMTAEQYKAAVDKRDRETPTRSIGDAALDTGISLLKGVIGLPEAFVGLADIPTKGKIGKLLEDYGY